ncbi:MAG: MFS transporter [Caldisericaceae bacterium]
MATDLEKNNYKNLKSNNKLLDKIREQANLHFPALGHRNFQLFFYGQIISLIGTWVQNIGQGWLVLSLTNSPFLLGLLTAVQFVPMMLFSLHAGVFVDRYSKRKILLVTQSSLAILAALLGLLAGLHIVQYWHVMILALVSGIVNSIDMTARQTFYVDLVGKEDLMNAISLGSSTFNLARIIGPAIAGILIAKLGYATGFYLNALSFVPVIAAIYIMHTDSKTSNAKYKSDNINKEILEGIRYVKNSPIIIISLSLLAVVNIFALNFNVLVPVFVKDVLKMGSQEYGLIMSAMGLGALIGSVALASISHKGVKDYYIFGGALFLSIFLILFGIQKSVLMSSVMIAISGIAMIVFLNSTNTTLQINSDDHFRGRVMSFYSLVFGGFTPIGSLYAGTVSQYVGSGLTLIISGAVTFSATIVFYLAWYRRRFGKLFKAELETPYEQSSSVQINEAKK